MTTPALVDLAHRKAAAASLNRLGHAIVGRQLDHRSLAEVEAFANEILELVEGSGANRERRAEILTAEGFGEALAAGDLGAAVEDGAFMDMFSDSPVSGSANPMNFGVGFARDGEEVVGRVTLGAAWEGAPGRAHGGIVAAIVDETLGGMLPLLGTMAFTGTLTVIYRNPCPLHVPLEFRARKVGQDGRKLYLACTGTADGEVFVESESTFITIELQNF